MTSGKRENGNPAEADESAPVMTLFFADISE
jgi:hypothetical protein